MDETADTKTIPNSRGFKFFVDIKLKNGKDEQLMAWWHGYGGDLPCWRRYQDIDIGCIGAACSLFQNKSCEMVFRKKLLTEEEYQYSMKQYGKLLRLNLSYWQPDPELLGMWKEDSKNLYCIEVEPNICLRTQCSAYRKGMCPSKEVLGRTLAYEAKVDWEHLSKMAFHARKRFLTAPPEPKKEVDYERPWKNTPKQPMSENDKKIFMLLMVGLVIAFLLIALS